MTSKVGQYRLLEILGQGGMGVVQRAIDLRTGREVAVKSLNAASPALGAAMRREIAALRGLRHPGVVEIYDYGTAQGGPWYAMELLQGHTLREHMAGRDWATQSVWTQGAQPTPSLAPVTDPNAPGAATDETVAAPDDSRIWRSDTLASDPPTAEAAALIAKSTRRVEGEVGHWDPERRSPKQRSPEQIRTASPEGSRTSTLPPSPPDATLRLVAEVCDALAYVHAAGLVHADLKPENIFLRQARDETFGRRAVLVDFGLAARLTGTVQVEDLETAGLRAGTMAYIAPERLCGTPYDPRSDLYAMGCILYELLCGQAPFTGTVPQVVHGHLGVAPAALRLAGRDAQLERLALRLLAKEPSERPRNATVVLHELRALGVDVPEPISPPRPWLHRAALSDRRHEREVLSDTLAQLGQRGQLWLITGAPGVGKSRLAMEAIRAARSAGVTVAVASARPHGPPLSAVAGLFPHGPPNPALEGLQPGEARAARLQLATEELGRAYPRGALFVVEDVHAADDLSLEWFEFLCRRGSPEHIFLLTAREGEALAGRLQCAGGLVSTLGPLPDPDLRELLRNTLAVTHAMPDLEDPVCARAGGSPFVATELLRSLVHRGVLDTGVDGDWFVNSLDGLGALALPDSVRGSVLARVDSLTPAALAVCRAAAVIASGITVERLEAAAGLDTTDIEAALAELRPHGILEPGQGAVAFPQDFLREVVYDDTDPVTRANMHARAAHALDAEPDPPLAAIARHWKASGQTERARAAFVRAARQARRDHALHDAATLYEEVVGTDDLALWAQVELLEVQLLLGIDADFAERAERTARATEPGDDRELESRAWAVFARVGPDTGQAYQHAIDAAHRGGHTLAQAAAMRAWALSILQTDRPREGLALLEQAVALLDGHDAQDDLGRCLVNMGLAHHAMCQRDDARRAAQRALEIFRQQGSPYAEAACINNLALLDQEQGLFAAARDRFYEVAAVHRGLGTLEREGLALANAAVTEHGLGQFHPARIAIDQACQIFAQLRDDRLLVYAHRLAALLHLERGDYTACEGHLAAAGRCTAPLALPEEIPYVTARLAMARGDTAQARAALTHPTWPNDHNEESKALHALVALEVAIHAGEDAVGLADTAAELVAIAGHALTVGQLRYLQCLLGDETPTDEGIGAVQRGLIAAYRARSLPDGPARDELVAQWRSVTTSMDALPNSGLRRAGVE